jgi:isoleucyl-tRNA synthetase
MQTHVDVPEVDVSDGWEAALAARNKAFEALEAAKRGGIENPLDAEVVVPDPRGVLRVFAADFADMLGVSRVSFNDRAESFTVNDLRSEAKCDRCWRRDPTTAKRSDGGTLCDRCAEAVGVK